ncbi:MAG: hypothetical protein KDD37_08405 [Bdellovibrionales bacterium]|nr:hypothetical protein [Bdellovibrionales bacterium]
MEKGFNSDVTSDGVTYHIQTEDWGRENPYLVSRVFRNGAVIKTIKTAYEEALKSGPSSHSESIRLAMREQHHQILDLINSGQFN